jgi:PhzF family phenazine biosynthesis protein
MSKLILPYTVLDVFTTNPWSEGNPLALITLTEDSAARITQEQKQFIAREFNFSETVFLHHYETPREQVGDSGGKKLRFDIFTKTLEIAFAGHPTIGTSFYCFNYVFPPDTQHGVLRCKAGDIVVQRHPETGLIGAEIPAQNYRVHSSGPGQITKEELIKAHPELEDVEIEDAFQVISIAASL